MYTHFPTDANIPFTSVLGLTTLLRSVTVPGKGMLGFEDSELNCTQGGGGEALEKLKQELEFADNEGVLR